MSKAIPFILALVIYSALAFTIEEYARFNHGPDEETNLAYSVFITETGRLPITFEERLRVGKDANWPALYHLTVAYISRFMDVDVTGPPHIKIFWNSFRYRAIDAGEDWYYLYTEDQHRPYLGQILVLHVGRWLSLAFGLLNLGLVYVTLRALIPDPPYLAGIGASVLAVWPAYVFMSGVMNEDTLIATFATLYFWMLVLIIHNPARRWWPYVVMGLAVGFSMTTKYTTVVLPLQIVLVFGLLAWRLGLGWGWAVGRIVLVGGVSALATAWWFGWNFWFMNRIEQHGWVVGLMAPLFGGGPDVTLARLGYFFSGGEIGIAERPVNRTPGAVTDWLRLMFVTFWTESPRDFNVYAAVGVVILLAVVGFGLWRLWRTNPAARTWLLLLWLHVGIFMILPVLRFVMTRRIGETAQGRHLLIPAGVAIVALLAWGLASAMPRRWQPWGFAAVLAGFALWSGVITQGIVTAARSPVPLRTATEAAHWLPNRLEARFDTIELASYDLQPGAGQVNIQLAWRAVGYTNQRYLRHVTVADAAGAVVTQWVGHPGNGRVPTLAWDPGDVVVDRLSLPLFDAPAGDYAVTIRLVDEYTGASLGETAALPFSVPAATDGPPEGVTMWGAAGLVDTRDTTVRYPATIGIVSREPVELIAPSGAVVAPWLAGDWLHLYVVGPRWESGQYRAGDVTVTVENWWDRHFALPEAVGVPLEANFADQIALIGYTLPQREVAPGEAFPLTLYWRAPADRPPQAHFIQFNHLLDAAGHLRGGYDRLPLEYYSTLLWAPGEVVVDGYTIPVEADAPPGVYYLNVGFYLTVGEAAVNLPLVEDNQPTARQSVSIGPILVVDD